MTWRHFQSRKRFNSLLWQVLSLLGLLGAIIGLSHAQAPAPMPAPRFQYANAIDDPLGQQRSLVLDVYGDFAIRGRKVHPASLQAMLTTGIKLLSGEKDPNRAWRTYITEKDMVALVFSPVGQREIATPPDVAGALLHCLYEVGFKPDNFMLVGLERHPPEAQGTRPCKYGWQDNPAEFGAGSDKLAAWLPEVTAIINVPSLLDDNIIGVRGALANLTWPLVKGPAQFYRNGGDPFLVEIYNLPQVRGKVRLHIANALRILYYGGPTVRESYICEHAALIFATDPVALDRVALEIIRRSRRNLTMPPGVNEILAAPWLDTAYALGLGYNDLNFIDYRRLRHEPQK